MWLLTLTLTLLLTVGQTAAPHTPSAAEGDFVIKNFKFTSGESLPERRMHYRTYGTPRMDAQGMARNAVLVMHGTGGTGGQSAGRNFAGELFGPGQPLDLRLVGGTSMGGMHTWMWREMYPDFMDALLPLASLPTQIAGRNRAWRRVVIDAIRGDPEWKNGDDTAQPQTLRTAAQMLWLVGSNPTRRQTDAPTVQDAERLLDAYVANCINAGDANDILYTLEASRDYDPGPALAKIKVPLVAINSADDIINPPELQILEQEIRRVPKGRAIVLPLSDRTAGHGTHTLAALWKEHLVALLDRTERVAAPVTPQPPAHHVIVITIDGLRWQEFFDGADRNYFKRDKKGDGGEPERRFWRADASERRATLMPFVWKTMAARGQIFGDPAAASTSRLTNGLWFSYPGYNEMFAGFADPRINSNDKVPNPNTTVLEWLNRRPGFEGRVAAFGSWDVLPSILNAQRSGITVGSGWKPVAAPATERERAINELASDLPRLWNYGPPDAPIVYAAIDHLRTHRSRVLYVMLGEGDEWAHEGRYDLYLDAAQRADRFIERIWNTAQAMPEYKDRTALLVTTDHGRGATTKTWTDHGCGVPAAERTWMALLGASVPQAGIRRAVNVTTSQIAATIAALVGEDFRAAVPGTAPPLPLTVDRRARRCGPAAEQGHGERGGKSAPGVVDAQPRIDGGVLQDAFVAREKGGVCVTRGRDEEPVERIRQRVPRDGTGVDGGRGRQLCDPRAGCLQRLPDPLVGPLREPQTSQRVQRRHFEDTHR